MIAINKASIKIAPIMSKLEARNIENSNLSKLNQFNPIS